MNRARHWAKQLAMVDAPEFNEDRERHRLNFFLIGTLVGFLVLMSFVIAAAFRGELLLPDLLMAAAFPVAYIVVRVTKLLFQVSVIVSSGLLAFLAFHVLTGSDDASQVFCYVFPPIVIYMLGLRWGLALSFLLATPMIAFLVMSIAGEEAAGYSTGFLIRFLLSYLIETMLFFLVEYQRREAQEEVKMLSGILPICASCKMIRDDEGGWNRIESYIQKRSDTQFSHGICPTCAKALYPDVDLSDVFN